jgi:hypothetical protein
MGKTQCTTLPYLAEIVIENSECMIPLKLSANQMCGSGHSPVAGRLEAAPPPRRQQLHSSSQRAPTKTTKRCRQPPSSSDHFSRLIDTKQTLRCLRTFLQRTPAARLLARHRDCPPETKSPFECRINKPPTSRAITYRPAS